MITNTNFYKGNKGVSVGPMIWVAILVYGK
jgi:hypothetical protein